MKYTITHRLSGAELFSAECESLRTCIELAVEAKFNLSGADLSRAYLSGADLSEADLSRAYLSDTHGVIHLGTPNGWHAHAWLRAGWLSIRVGCREMRLVEAREYWTGKLDRREVMAAIDYAQCMAVLRDWPIMQPVTEAA